VYLVRAALSLKISLYLKKNVRAQITQLVLFSMCVKYSHTMRAYNFICTRCGYTTTHRGSFDKHEKRLIPCDAPAHDLECPICHRVLSNIFSLRRHISILHTTVQPVAIPRDISITSDNFLENASCARFLTSNDTIQQIQVDRQVNNSSNFKNSCARFLKATDQIQQVHIQ
jgi:hypothetical protein